MTRNIGCIKNIADNFAITVSDVLDTDVVIIDSKMNIIGSSFKYFSLYNKIRDGSLMAEVLTSSEKICVRDKSKIDSCKNCMQYRICKMTGFIGVPILYENKVLGAIALILKKSKVNTLFEKIDSTTEFMENISQLLALHINECDKKKCFIPGTSVTLSWLSKYVNNDILKEAEKLAQNDNSILIYGYDNAINELIAKSIFNCSCRRLQEVKVIYIQNVYRDLLNTYLLGEFGIIRNMDKGTLIMVQPEQMTLYVQDKLAEIINTKRIKGKHGDVSVDVRFIFCTTENLHCLTQKGLFSDKLYNKICKDQLYNINSIYNNLELLKKFVESSVEYYNKIYYKSYDVKIIQEIISAFKNYKNHYSLSRLDLMIENCIRTGTTEWLNSKNDNINKNNIDVQSVDQFMKRKVKKLLSENKSKKEICELMNISRSTLYRKIKEYGY